MGTKKTSKDSEKNTDPDLEDPAAMEQFFSMLYQDLHQLAGRYLRRERAGHTLQPTALLNEVYLKLAGQTNLHWQGKTHFFAVGAQAMRRILVDHERHKRRAKRGGKRARLDLDENLVLPPDQDTNLVDLDEALTRLAELDPRQAQIVELRFFGGMTVEEISQLLGVSKRTVEGDWTHAKAWLRAALNESSM